MAFCGKCGNALVEGQGFCPHCGAPVAAAPPPPQYGTPPPEPPPYGSPHYSAPQYGAPPPLTAATGGMQENVAGFLCYLFGWITGIIFLLIDKRPFVRFHAAQSIVVFGALTIVRIILAIAFSGSWYFGLGILHLLIFTLFGLFGLVLWIILMIQAFQGKQFELPLAADIAKNLARSVNL